MSFKEDIERINSISLRDIIERFGGQFINDKQFKCLSIWGEEKSPSGFIYLNGNKENWKHFESGKGGDAVDFVELAMNCNKEKAIELILNESRSYTFKSREIIIKENQKALKDKENKDRMKMFAIAKNSTDILNSNLGITYLDTRGILKAYQQLKNPNFKIFINSFKGKDGNIINNICYLFGKSKENNHRFMIMKGINENGSKNGKKYNLLNTRPIMHIQQKGKPIILCEGIEDSLSGVALGYDNFISLNSTSNVNQFLISMKECSNFYRVNAIELCLDNDDSGIKAVNKIKSLCYLQDHYYKGNIKDLFTKLKEDPIKNKHIVNIIASHKRIEEFSNNEIITVCNRLTEIDSILKDIKEYKSKYFRIKDSEFTLLLKEMNCNDLNDLLIKTEKAEKDLDFIKNNPIKENKEEEIIR